MDDREKADVLIAAIAVDDAHLKINAQMNCGRLLTTEWESTLDKAHKSRLDALGWLQSKGYGIGNPSNVYRNKPRPGVVTF